MKQLIKEAMFHLVMQCMLASIAYAISTPTERYVLIPDPPSVAVVDFASFKVVESIALGNSPEYALLGPENRFLYVLSHKIAKKKDPEGDQSEVTIIDPGSRKIIKNIPFTGKVRQFLFTDDGRYLFCFAPGNVIRRSETVSYTRTDILFIDTRTNEVADSFSTDRPPEQVVFRKDLSRIFALAAAFITKPNDPRSPIMLPAQLTVFQSGATKPVATISLPDKPLSIGLSPDEKWLYVLDRGYHNHWSIPHLPMNRRDLGRRTRKDNEKNHRAGSVRVYDAALLNEVASHNLGTSPWKLFADPASNTTSVLGFAEDGIRGKLHELRGKDLITSFDVGECPQRVMRFADLPGRLVISYTDIRFLPDDAKTQPFTLPLNVSKIGPQPSGSSQFLDGWPGEALYVPQSQRILVGAIRVGDLPPNRFYELYVTRGGFSNRPWPEREVMFFNVPDRKIERLVKIGRGEVKFGKVVGEFALALGIGMATGIASYSAMSPYYITVYPVSSNRNLGSERLALSPDRAFVYALHAPTNDVTILKTATGEVVDKVAVGGGAYRLFATPDGKFVCAHTSEDITFIDTATNKIHLKHHLPDGKVILMEVDETAQQIYALGTKSILVFDAKTAKLLGTVEGISNPQWLVAPTNKQPAATGQ
ncbi:MAG: YncE family protein [Blastocatellia bacterium]